MEKDIIKQSFKELQEAEPVNEGGFIIEPMNKCIDEAHKLPPLISLYPEVVKVIFVSSSGSPVSARRSTLCR